MPLVTLLWPTVLAENGITVRCRRALRPAGACEPKSTWQSVERRRLEAGQSSAASTADFLEDPASSRVDPALRSARWIREAAGSLRSPSRPSGELRH